ncbi:MAG TPA: CaiB/BaiF CoA-transferase family protein [Candidatus Dormibacteraeota bacterium]|nr:CaiB/BaiF CoA-transferase family protein [Candidatus Dormibacteraeota bacterium]
MAVPRKGPLDGLRVLDLTRVLVGPYATMLLGDLGAEVIKVERPGDGDETRHVPPLKEGESHYFVAINRNKKGMAVDMKAPAGRELLVDLARHCDILVENFRPGVAGRLGLDHETLLAVNPRLVYCSISAFGQTGPYASRAAFDIAIQAISGMMSLTGEPGGPPTRMGLPMADLCGGLFAVIGILSAIHEREQTGRGQFIDYSMLDGMVGMLMYTATRVFMTGEDSPKVGTGHLGIVPYGAFAASDGHIVIANIGEAFWPKICAAIGRPELAADPRYDSNRKRVSRREEVEALLGEALAERTVAEWDEILERHDVPHAPILEVSEVLANEQVLARGLVTEYEHPRLGRFPAVGRAIRFPAYDGLPMRPPPLLGEDDEAVLRDLLGYDAERIAQLREGGVIV